MSVLSLPAAKQFLQVRNAVAAPAQDSELQEVIVAAEEWVADRVGPLTPTEVTGRICGSTGTLTLPITPVISLTSITPVTGAALDVSVLKVNPDSGVVSYISGVGCFTALEYDVIYQAGRQSVPHALRQAIKEMVLLMWAPQRGPTNRGQIPDRVPERIYELLSDDAPLAFG